MSRSGYDTDGWDFDEWAYIRAAGARASAIRGKRGQLFFLELIAALDALPEPKLIADELEVQDGAVCAIGAVGKRRGLDMSKLDPEDAEIVAGAFGIAECLARDVVYENDEAGPRAETPEQRFQRMRDWAISNLRDIDPASLTSRHAEAGQK